MTGGCCFTRTDDSEKFAASIAAQTGGEIFRIRDNRNWPGPFGFVRACFYAARKRTLPAVCEAPGEGGAICLCFPVRAGGFPPAVRAFAGEVGYGRIIAVPGPGGNCLSRAGGLRQSHRGRRPEEERKGLGPAEDQE